MLIPLLWFSDRADRPASSLIMRVHEAQYQVLRESGLYPACSPQRSQFTLRPFDLSLACLHLRQYHLVPLGCNATHFPHVAQPWLTYSYVFLDLDLGLGLRLLAHLRSASVSAHSGPVLVPDPRSG